MRIWSIFTKPWQTQSIGELGAYVSGLGFNAIEFPLRPGYQAEPKDAEAALPALARQLAEYGVGIASVASGTDEATFRACAAAGVKILRIMLLFDRSAGWRAGFDAARRQLDGLVPLAEKYGVTVGVQQHYGFGIFGTMELRAVLDGYDPRHIAGIWDAAHSALAGEIPAQALDIIYDKLCMVNFKAAFPRRMNGPEAAHAFFQPHFTTARNGATNWKDAADYLIAKGYEGVLCMPAEYTDTAAVEQYIAKDFEYLRSLFV